MTKFTLCIKTPYMYPWRDFNNYTKENGFTFYFCSRDAGCRDEVEYNYHLAKKISTEGKLFRTVIPKIIESDEYTSPGHVDVAFSQSGNSFAFKTLVSDIGQGASSFVATEKVMFTSNYDSRQMCTSCKESHSIWNKDDVNILLSDQNVPAVVPSRVRQKTQKS